MLNQNPRPAEEIAAEHRVGSQDRHAGPHGRNRRRIDGTDDAAAFSGASRVAQEVQALVVAHVNEPMDPGVRGAQAGNALTDLSAQAPQSTMTTSCLCGIRSGLDELEHGGLGPESGEAKA